MRSTEIAPSSCAVCSAPSSPGCRSRIVNIARVKELNIAGGGDCQVVLWDGTRLGLSRLYRDPLQAQLSRR